MAIFGLFAGRGTVNGRIAVENRPASTQFVLTAQFFPVAAGAAAPFGHWPDDAEANAANAVTAEHVAPTAKGGCDPGANFSVKLAPGHYQLCVGALPFVIEDKRMILDPARKSGHWPLAKPVEVQKNEIHRLKISVTIASGAGPLGDAAPFLTRIGPALTAAYAEVSKLANSGNHEEALERYRALGHGPLVDALKPEAREELRIVVVTGRARCFLDLNRVNEAAAELGSLGVLPDCLAPAHDPFTRMDFLDTSSAVFARMAKWDEARACLTLAFAARQYALPAAPASFRPWSANALLASWVRCLRLSHEAKAWRALEALALAGQECGPDDELAALRAACTCAEIEALVRKGARAEAAAIAKKCFAGMRQAGASLATIAQFTAMATNLGFTDAALLLRG